MNRQGKWLRGAAWVLAILAAVVATAIFAGLQLGKSKMQRRVEVAVQPVPVRTDAQALERGKYLFASRGCVDCHGANGAGRFLVDDAKSGVRIAGPNITTGPGSVVSAYKPVDWVRSIRHGVNPQGRALMVMPSEDYNRFTNDDMASLVAYVQSLPPVPGQGAVVELPLPARVMYGFGLMKDAAARIDHTLPPPQPVAEGVTAAHGAYVANMCIGCHGAKLAGGKIPGAPPDWPPAPNLTPGEGSAMVRYPDADAMVKLFRTGKRPDGSAVSVMPFDSLKEMNETDVRALHLYLKGVAAQKAG